MVNHFNHVKYEGGLIFEAVFI